jgi:hypothetical protein
MRNSAGTSISYRRQTRDDRGHELAPSTARLFARERARKRNRFLKLKYNSAG